MCDARLASLSAIPTPPTHVRARHPHTRPPPHSRLVEYASGFAGSRATGIMRAAIRICEIVATDRPTGHTSTFLIY
eukprot:3931538-Pleurochrysis_carterae.AAC.3